MACLAVTSTYRNRVLQSHLTVRYHHGSIEQLSSHPPCQHTLDGARYAVLYKCPPGYSPARCLFVPVCSPGWRDFVDGGLGAEIQPAKHTLGNGRAERTKPRGQVVNGNSANVNAAMLLSGRGLLWSMIVPFWWRLGNRRALGTLGHPPSWRGLQPRAGIPRALAYQRKGQEQQEHDNV
jgi:hypothetical protein